MGLTEGSGILFHGPPKAVNKPLALSQGLVFSNPNGKEPPAPALQTPRICQCPEGMEWRRGRHCVDSRRGKLCNLGQVTQPL